MFYYWANLPKYKPFDGQLCWVRTVNSFFFPFIAEWDALTESFISVVTGLVYDKTVISRWKEILSSPGKTYAFTSDNIPLNPLRIDINGIKHFYYSINWGDGRTNSGYFTGTIISITHTYSVAANYNVVISTPSASITYLRIANEPLIATLPDLSENNYLTFLNIFNCGLTGAMYSSLPWPLLSDLNFRSNVLTGPFPSVANTPLLAQIVARNNQLTGNLPDFTVLPLLNTIELDTNQFTGTIPSLSNCPLLAVLRLASNLLNGPIPDLSNNVLLDNIYLTSCGLSGTIPSLSNLTVLRTIQVNTNAFSGYTSSVLALTLVTFIATTNNLPAASINQILADFVTNLAARPAVGTVNLAGVGNAAPTGQGLLDKAAIIAKGWSCVTN